MILDPSLHAGQPSVAQRFLSIPEGRHCDATAHTRLDRSEVAGTVRCTIGLRVPAASFEDPQELRRAAASTGLVQAAVPYPEFGDISIAELGLALCRFQPRTLGRLHAFCEHVSTGSCVPADQPGDVDVIEALKYGLDDLDRLRADAVLGLHDEDASLSISGLAVLRGGRHVSGFELGDILDVVLDELAMIQSPGLPPILFVHADHLPTWLPGNDDMGTGFQVPDQGTGLRSAHERIASHRWMRDIRDNSSTQAWLSMRPDSQELVLGRLTDGADGWAEASCFHLVRTHHPIVDGFDE